ncbi:MAG: MFS transporter [Bacteroidales bacterium]|nr:MFS transporter [Bacteroidales bacterium]
MQSANRDIHPSGVSNFRWRVLVLLFFATTINYIDRQVIGILKPYIAGDLGWSEADYGYIVTAFQLAYATGLLLAGKFLDKFGTKYGYAVAIILWSIAGMAHAAARGAMSFALARFSLGIGEAANFPAAIKTVAEWFPKKERAFATGLFNSGSNIGAIVAPVVVSGITLGLGWQWAFIITGTLGFIWVVFWLLFYYAPKDHPYLSKKEYDYIHSDDTAVDTELVKWSSLLKYRQTMAICSSRFITEWVWWFFLFWVPDILNKIHGINIKDVVFPLIVIYTISGFGGIGGGWLSSHFIKNGKSIDFARKTTILICAVCVVPIAFVLTAKNLWVAVGIISLAAAAHAGWAANIFTVVSDIYPKNTAGSMVGISGFAGAIGGALFASLVGIILQVTGSYLPVFILAGSAYLIAWAILKLGIKEIKPIDFAG